jgi:hypothetical protein
MKENLLTLLMCHPLMKGCSRSFLDDLADDLSAVIVRTVVPENIDSVTELEHRVSDVYNDHFGVKLSNLFTTEYFKGRIPLVFSDRQRVVKAMIQTMLIEESAVTAFNELADEGRGELLKRRLQELNCTTTIN